MKSILVYIQTHAIQVGIAAIIVVAAGGYWVISDSGSEKIEVLTVHAGPFVQEISASGKVVPARDVELGFTQGGRVARGAVEVGSYVRLGQVLAALDNADLEATILQRQAALDTQRAKLAGLTQGTRPEEIAIAEADVEKNRIARAQAEDALIDEISNAYTVADDAIRNNLYQFISNERTSVPRLDVQTTDFNAALELQNSSVAAETALVEWSAELLTLTSSNLSAATAKAQERLRVISGVLMAANKVLNKAFVTADHSQATLDGYVSDIASVRAGVSASQSALTTAITAYKNAESGLDAAERNLTLKKAGTIQPDIDAQEAQVKAAEAELANARAQLAKTVITAPFSGVITSMDAKVGSIVGANTPVISMIGSGTYQIESFIPEVNIVNVKRSNRARITLDAYGTSVDFEATVIAIDPAETITNGISTYKTTLQFTRQDERIRSGMTANMRIETATLEGVLSIPRGALYERQGIAYVQIRAESAIEERAVVLADISSLSQVVIASGLNEGDEVVLSPTE